MKPRLAAAPVCLAFSLAALAGTVGQPRVFRGACDASGAVAIGISHILVADDEDRERTRLRLYE